MNVADRSLVREGAASTCIITGAVAYFHYRERIRKEFMRSEAHYRLNSEVENITPWKQLYWTWWRMPEQEFNVYHRFKPYFILGQIDYTKEVLIPRTKDGVKGFDVINPLYCYEGGKQSFKNLLNGDDPVKIERAAIIVNRGWIPYKLRDRKTRPTEINSRQLIKMKGVFRAGKDIHDYKVPNNPDNNEWHNLSLEDIGIFWDLPNWDEAKYYYFQAIEVDGGPRENQFQKASGVVPDSRDHLVDNHYGWRWSEGTHKLIERGFGLTSLGFLAISFLAA